MCETWVRSLGREDSLEKETATHSSIFAQKIPWTEERGAGYCAWGYKESGTTEQLHFTSLHFVMQSKNPELSFPTVTPKEQLLMKQLLMGKKVGKKNSLKQKIPGRSHNKRQEEQKHNIVKTPASQMGG